MIIAMLAGFAAALFLLGTGVYVLLKHDDRKGGTVKLPGVTVEAPGAGMVLVALGVGLLLSFGSLVVDAHSDGSGESSSVGSGDRRPAASEPPTATSTSTTVEHTTAEADDSGLTSDSSDTTSTTSGAGEGVETIYLSDKQSLRGDGDDDGSMVATEGRSLVHSLDNRNYFSCSTSSSITYDLTNLDVEHFVSLAEVSDDSSQYFVATVEVRVDNRAPIVKSVDLYKSEPIDVNVRGARRLTLWAESKDDCNEAGEVVWSDARLTSS